MASFHGAILTTNRPAGLPFQAVINLLYLDLRLRGGQLGKSASGCLIRYAEET